MTTASAGGKATRAHVAADELGARRRARRGRARRRARISSMPVTAHAGGRRRPSRRASGRAAPRRCAASQQAGQQALAAADVEHARARARSGRGSRRWRNTGSQRSLPRAKCQAKRPARRYGALGRSISAGQAGRRRRRHRRVAPRRPPRRCAGQRVGSVTGRRPAAAMRSSSAGSTASTTGWPLAGARGVAVVQQQDVAGAEAVASAAPARAAGSRRTVSKPRRVQLTSCRPSRSQHRREQRIAQARRRAEEARRCRR